MSTPGKETVDPMALKAAFEATRECGESPNAGGGARRRSRCVERLLNAIHEEIFDPLLSVQALKTRCGIQDNNISSRFRSEVGQSIKEYIDSLRLVTARRLLLETDSSVFEVSQAVGYYHPQTFYRAFHRLFKRTPGDLRGTGTPHAMVAACEMSLGTGLSPNGTNQAVGFEFRRVSSAPRTDTLED